MFFFRRLSHHARFAALDDTTDKLTYQENTSACSNILYPCYIVSTGLVFFSSISVTAQYFEKRRGLANGIAVAGSGIGGLALAPLIRMLITEVGFRWTLRITGFAVLGFLMAIFAFIRPRIKSAKRGPIFDLSVFSAPGFKPLLFSAFIVTFGYMVPIFLMPTFVVEVIGESASRGATLISIFSVS